MVFDISQFSRLTLFLTWYVFVWGTTFPLPLHLPWTSQRDISCAHLRNNSLFQLECVRSTHTVYGDESRSCLASSTHRHTHTYTPSTSRPVWVCEQHGGCLISPPEASALGPINRLIGFETVTKWVSGKWKAHFQALLHLHGATKKSGVEQKSHTLLRRTNPTLRESFSIQPLLLFIHSQGTRITAFTLFEMEYISRV